MDDIQAHWRGKRLRCSVCTWRGTWAEAEDAPRVQAAPLDPNSQLIQNQMEEKEAQAMQLGQPHSPPCPECGHHVVVVARSSIRPAT